MAERLEVSRPTLREAKQILTSKGLFKSHQGGGTYVISALNSSISDPLMNLLKERPEFKFDILELRYTLDSEAAFLAAFRAIATEKENIKEKYDIMVSFHLKREDHVASVLADVNFHLSITEASHNIALLHITRSIYNVLLTSIENNLKYLYTLKGDSKTTKLAAKTHMEFVNKSLSEMNKDKERQERFLHHSSVLSKTNIWHYFSGGRNC